MTQRKGEMVNKMKLGLFIILVTSLAATAYTAEKPQVEIKSTKTVNVVGELISLKPSRANPLYIGIAGKNSDAYFEIDENVKIVHKRSLEEINLGDTISITYDDIVEVIDGGKEQNRRSAKVIRFIKVGEEGRLRRVGPGEFRKSIEPAKTGVLRSLEK